VRQSKRGRPFSSPASLTVFLAVALWLPVLQASSSYLQTGVVDGPLPLTEDVSFIVELPGTLSDRAVPLIHGGDAYLMMRARGGANDLRNNAIYRVSLSNASVEKIATL
jgi:hypothetical protein